MYDERIDKMIEEDPSLEWIKRVTETGIVVISPNVEKYENDSNQLKGYDNKSISKQLIIDLITHDDSFNKIKKLFETGGYSLYILFVNEKGVYKNQYSLGRMVIIDLLKQINPQEIPSIITRYNQLMDYVSYEKYKEKTQNDIYEITIDGKYYQIPVSLFYHFVSLDNENFNNILLNNKVYENIPLPHFLHAVYKYFSDNHILTNYLVDDKLKERIEEINSSKIVDVQMINKYLDTSDSILEQVKVNNELEDLILCDISPEFNDLEKAIYIYIKMCKVLTYDEEFYAVNQKGPLSEKHKKISNISNISLDNNKVVCYEFDAIYSYFLHKIGINYKRFVGTVNGNGVMGEDELDDDFYKYSDGHTFLKCRCGKYLVKADSVTSILQGDIMQAKLNQPLVGLVCENTNEQTKEEFLIAMHKVYSYIAAREPRLTQNDVEKTESFEEIVAQFVSQTDKLRPVDVREKIDILINKVNSTRLIGIDAYSYLLQLRKILFTPQEQRDNIKISIIRNSTENFAEAISIISLRLPNENGDMIVSRYIFKPGTQLIPISREELQERFDNQTMGYVEEKDPKIPGIKK